MERTTRTMKAGLAALLVVMILTLGGMAVTSPATYTNLLMLVSLANATANAQKVAVNTVPQVDNSSATAQTNAAQQVPAQQQSRVVDARDAVRVAGPAVVTVVNTMQQATTGRGRFGGQGQGQAAPEALGSGVIIDNQGHIVTNQHVIDNQQSLQVIFADGTQVPATLVGQDAYSDLAVIKVDAKVPAVAKFGDSDKLEPGQPVVAIGTALGTYNNTVTEGIISAMHRALGDGGTSTQDLIQTDAAINHGNSGGPLLDLNGNVIGINTAVVRDSGITGDVAEGLGFAIPSNTAKRIAAQLLQSGSVSHPYLGITYQLITPQIATENNLSRQEGIFVTDVATGSPADKAGLQANSIITRFEGTDLSNATDSTLAQLLSTHKVGDSVKVTVIAPGSTAEKEITIVLGERPTGQ
ncbi:MAG: trypsin-like peptidase domain-containing protein [Chloroflexota bacterium]